MVLADEQSPMFMAGGAGTIAAMWFSEDRISRLSERVKASAGMNTTRASTMEPNTSSGPATART